MPSLDVDRELEPVDADIINRYRLYSVVVQHYSVAAAFSQKVLAYLEPDCQSHYRQKKVWDALQAQVLEALEGLQS